MVNIGSCCACSKLLAVRLRCRLLCCFVLQACIEWHPMLPWGNLTLQWNIYQFDGIWQKNNNGMFRCHPRLEGEGTVPELHRLGTTTLLEHFAGTVLWICWSSIDLARSLVVRHCTNIMASRYITIITHTHTHTLPLSTSLYIYLNVCTQIYNMNIQCLTYTSIQ